MNADKRRLNPASPIVCPAIVLLASVLFAPSLSAEKAEKKDRAHDLFVDTCSSCHSLARIYEYSYSKEEWREETKGMISEGTVLTDEELDLLLNYLAKNFGPADEPAPAKSKDSK